MAQYGAGSTSAGGAAGGGGHIPLEITSGVDFGYDDHVIGSNAATNSSSPSSFFARENLVLIYSRPEEASETEIPTEISLIAVGRFTQYFDVGTDDKDLNVTFALAHNFSTRLSFRADVYTAYQTEPNFQSNIGPQNVRAPHLEIRDIFSLTYHWLPRVAFITSYTFERIQYEQTNTTTTAIGFQQDRSQYTFAETLVFNLTRRTNLIAEYRYLIVDYDTFPNNSTTHFALAGFGHSLTENLRISLLGGESFRSFENDGNTIDPYIAATVTYHGSNSSLAWITTYGVEQGTQTNASGNTTFRTGVNLTHHLTSGISAHASLFYNNNGNQGAPGTTSSGSQNNLQTILGLRYPINRHFAANVSYEYTANGSAGGSSGISRNRVWAGVTYRY